MALLLLMLFGVASVHSQPDQTACDNGGAYDTTTGTASCGGIVVNFFDLVCGKGFNQQSCVAKWTNPSGDEEDYFFMGAGAGIEVTDLPASCSGITTNTPLAMVQYYPSGGCYPAADLQGTQASYTPSGDGKSIDSVTLTFAEHDDGRDVRDGYIKITCGDHTSGFTTNGDTDVSSKYEVSVTAPCATPPAYRCVDNACKHVADGGGTTHDDCAKFCGNAAVYRCEHDRCVVAVNGSSLEACSQVCGSQQRSTDITEK
eukprot:m.110400 g.110400  ORF g.110400 m.110400 type:complete len:258 (+) comp28035_c0_seq1:35-808(+)